MARIVTFGEIMIRLSPPGRELLLQTPKLDLWVAGAEANVATALAVLGHDSALVSALPASPLGDGALRHLRGAGVDVRGIERREGRMGLYFVTTGAGLRATDVLYDRAGSVFAEMSPKAWDWDRLLEGADRLHLSGITPALGPAGAEAALRAADAAALRGISLSFDGNYRARLWDAWDSNPRDILTRLVSRADILFGNHRDISLLLGPDFNGDKAGRRDAADAAFAAFPHLRLIASTERDVLSVDQHRLAARIDERDRSAKTEEVVVSGIVDRIGAGDAFTAGILHGLYSGQEIAATARTGLALAALKHSLPGDASLFGQADVDAFLAGELDVRR